MAPANSPLGISRASKARSVTVGNGAGSVTQFSLKPNPAKRQAANRSLVPQRLGQADLVDQPLTPLTSDSASATFDAGRFGEKRRYVGNRWLHLQGRRFEQRAIPMNLLTRDHPHHRGGLGVGLRPDERRWNIHGGEGDQRGGNRCPVFFLNKYHETHRRDARFFRRKFTEKGISPWSW